VKRFLLCIVVFLFLFLTVGSYVVHAQPCDALLQMDGKWLKISGSVKGYDFGATGDSAATGQAYSEKINQYAFVSYAPENAYATLDIYDKWGENTGDGTLYWISGTNDNWLAEIDIGMNLGTNMIHATMPMLAKVKSGTEGAQKGTFKSITVRGVRSPAIGLPTAAIHEEVSANGLANYFGGKVSATILKKTPFPVTCPGYTPVPVTE